ncbi:MAG: hypothetical protein FWG25_09355 [Promicromonosporaceae bacterium]|nr:hypothetical protein [Promicromonosporaceae bacterium]
MSLVLTIILAVLVAGVSLGAAWVSGHAKEYYVQHPPKSKVLSQVVFWFSVLGLTATLFLILLPLLAAFVNLEMDIGSYLEVGPFIAGLWPLYLVILALLVPTTLALAFSLRPPKPVLTAAEQQAQGIPAARYRHYPRSNLIFIPMMSHRRRAYQYHSSMAAAGRAGQMSGGMGSAAGGMSGGMGASSYAGGMAGGMGRSGAAGGMSGGMAASSYAGGMTGGMGMAPLVE